MSIEYGVAGDILSWSFFQIVHADSDKYDWNQCVFRVPGDQESCLEKNNFQNPTTENNF